MQVTITGYHIHATDGEIGHKERKTHQKEEKNGK